MKPKLTLALVAILTSSAFAAIPAVLPEFKNAQQLAEWRDEMAAKHAASTTATDDHAFYTGKPYIESTGTYAFKYRSYNPELARWTSEDPSGFPDGANNIAYMAIPTSELDFLGLYSLAQATVDLNLVLLTIGGWEILGYDMAVSLAVHSLNFGENQDIPGNHLTALTESSLFTNQFNKSWFDTFYGSQGSGTYSHSHVVNYGKTSDLGNAYGNVSYAFTVNVSEFNSGFKYVVDYSTPNEKYDFSTTSLNPAVAAFARLQENNYASIFLSSGNFQKVYE